MIPLSPFVPVPYVPNMLPKNALWNAPICFCSPKYFSTCSTHVCILELLISGKRPCLQDGGWRRANLLQSKYLFRFDMVKEYFIWLFEVEKCLHHILVIQETTGHDIYVTMYSQYIKYMNVLSAYPTTISISSFNYWSLIDTTATFFRALFMFLKIW